MCDRESYTSREIERLVLGALLEQGRWHAARCAELGIISDFVESELDLREVMGDRMAIPEPTALGVFVDALAAVGEYFDNDGAVG